MAGKSSREILMEDLRQMEDGMERLSTTKTDIWQDELIWWLCKAVRDILLWIVERGDKMIKVLFSHRIRIQELFESWCIKNGAAGSLNNMIAFMEQKGWLNSDKIVNDLKHMTVD